MPEFLSDNLFIVIAVVIFIVLRIVSASRKRAAASRQDEAAEAENSPVDDDDRTISLGHWEVEKESQPKPVPQPSYTRKTLEEASLAHRPLTSLAESAPLSFADKIVNAPAIYSPPELIPAEPSTPAPVGQSPRSSAPDLSALDQLSELKRAVVFSEILAPPISLRG